MKFKFNADWWDAFFKMLSIVLVPLTVAGMGWYWTRWQQNVNDLKSMIDLVTDKSPEKQKYGIAMFEYLRQERQGAGRVLRSADRLRHDGCEPRASCPCSRSRSRARRRKTPTWRKPIASRWSGGLARVFIHVPNDDTYTCLVRLREAFEVGDKAGVIFPAELRKYAGYADSNQELRFFHAGDKPRADQIVSLFGTLGLELTVKDISTTPVGA